MLAVVPRRGIAFSVVRNKPHYSVSSVDHALHLATLLQQEGALRVTDAAARLGVAPSTAHRLLTTLVYRDFAERLPDRRYGPGKVLRPAAASTAPVDLLRKVSLPFMRQLVEQTGETVSLTVMAGREVRIVATVESSHALRVGDRMGRALPARLASGGKAMLALLPEEVVVALHGDDPDVDPVRLSRELATVRQRGIAINDQLTENGLTAIGMAVRDDSGAPVGAVAVAMPTVRFDSAQLPGWVAAMAATVNRIESAILFADD
jgi:IclR family transcriptional regulator, acetate operon repressor